VSKGFGGAPLFAGVSLGIYAGDHIGLIGPNGAGKTTLLRILAGEEEPDHGKRVVRRGVRVGYVPQDPSFAERLSVGEVLDQSLAARGVAADEREGRVQAVLGRSGFADSGIEVGTLSGGWLKRLAIAREMVCEPDVLFLDEPTNHLDVDGILWLEELLRSEPRAFLAVSHDRWFLENVAARVVELNRIFPAGTFAADGAYHEFLAKRDQLLEEQEDYRVSLRNRVRREMEWLARGAKARTSKSQARIKDAGRLIGELAAADGRAAGGQVGLQLGSETRRAKRLLVAEGVGKTRGERRVLDDVNLILTPGTRIGVLGPNGVGKSTLLAILAGTLAPDEGKVERLQGLVTVQFEQDRGSLDPNTTLRRALAPEGDSVIYRGQAVHAVSWARRFLFRPEQLDVRVSALSGGEQARILLARLMLVDASLLLLDEPTNDLDIPTLEILEEALLEFPGAIVLVTHDRYLLERVATAVLALDGSGRAELYADYGQWETARRAAASAAGGPRAAAGRVKTREAAPGKRLGYLEQREWEGIEAAVQAADAEVGICEAAMADPAVASDPAALSARLHALEAARATSDRLWARWAELEAKRG